MMAVRCNGLRAVSVTLIRGKKLYCLVRSLMCCSHLAMAYFQRDAGHKIDTIEWVSKACAIGLRCNQLIYWKVLCGRGCVEMSGL
jgi:hypothetical protein